MTVFRQTLRSHQCGRCFPASHFNPPKPPTTLTPTPTDSRSHAPLFLLLSPGNGSDSCKPVDIALVEESFYLIHKVPVPQLFTGVTSGTVKLLRCSCDSFSLVAVCIYAADRASRDKVSWWLIASLFLPPWGGCGYLPRSIVGKWTPCPARLDVNIRPTFRTAYCF